ncbi:MAG: matrixin family metalloprotease [Bacteriovoracaceae bacterium]|nr:matrixin family metalloprotease [Bacteriovoracaceae bacterium]
MKTLFLILGIVFSLSVEAYVLTRGTGSSYVRWPTPSPGLTLYLNPSNNDGISDAEVLNIVNASAVEWNNSSAVNIGVSTTTVSGIDGRNEIYFSNNSLYFTGSGVVGLTNISYREQDGAILETDILLNDSIYFFDSSTLLSSDPNENYLGNVISHEIGHMIGLGHSQVHDTTMFYKLYNGQHSLSSDDISGAQAYYPNTSNGIIKGKMIGSKELIGVIGVQVQAISASTGKVVSAALTEGDGTFAITGLNLNEQYFLYHKPLKVLDTLPGMYSDSRTDFCNAGSDYRGAFFQSCYNRDEGYPMGINVTSSSTVVNVGNVSIQCGLKVPPEYFLSKGTAYNVDVVDDLGNAGNTFVGFFTDNQIAGNQEDEVHVDLTSYTVPSNDLYLDVKLVYQPFYSEMYLNMDVEFVSQPTKSYPVQPVVYNQDKNPKLDFHEKFLLSNVDNNENYFKFKVTPTSLLTFLAGYSFPPIPVRTDFFPELNTFKDVHHFYMMIITVSKKNPDGSYTTYSKRKYDLSDNTSCPDAPRTYKVSANTYNQTATSRKLAETDDLGLPVACGTIDWDNNEPPSGGLRNGMILGMLLCLSFLMGIQRKYSKE